MCQGLGSKFVLAAVRLNKVKKKILYLGRLFREDPTGAMHEFHFDTQFRIHQAREVFEPRELTAWPKMRAVRAKGDLRLFHI